MRGIPTVAAGASKAAPCGRSAWAARGKASIVEGNVKAVPRITAKKCRILRRIPRLRAGDQRADERARDSRRSALPREARLHPKQRTRSPLGGCRAPGSCLRPKQRMHPSVALAGAPRPKHRG